MHAYVDQNWRRFESDKRDLDSKRTNLDSEKEMENAEEIKMKRMNDLLPSVTIGGVKFLLVDPQAVAAVDK